MISAALLQSLSEQGAMADAEGVFPEESFRLIADAGLLSVVLPGNPLDFGNGRTANLLDLLKMIGSADLATGRIFEGHVNALYLIHLFGTAEQQTRWYDDVSSDHALFSVWNTEAKDGVHIHVAKNGRFRLEGAKTFCSGAGYIQRPLVTGYLQTSERAGWQMCIVPIEKVAPIKEDASSWQPMGMRGSVSYRMDFTGVEIGGEDFLGYPNDYYRQPAFGMSAIHFAAVQLGGAEAMLNATHHYLKELYRTEDVFQKSRIAEMAWLITSGNQWLDSAANNTDRWIKHGSKEDQIIAYANMTRTAVEEICIRTMQLAERCVGARGMMRPYQVERIHRDLTLYLRQPSSDASLTAIADYVFNLNRPAHEFWR